MRVALLIFAALASGCLLDWPDSLVQRDAASLAAADLPGRDLAWAADSQQSAAGEHCRAELGSEGGGIKDSRPRDRAATLLDHTIAAAERSSPLPDRAPIRVDRAVMPPPDRGLPDRPRADRLKVDAFACAPGAKQSCGIQVGECKTGQQLCGLDGKWGPCTGGVKPTSEVCDGKDNDCDGSIDEGLTVALYQDADRDGFGDPKTTKQLCSPVTGWVSNALDCYDGNKDVYPGQTAFFTQPSKAALPYDYNCDGKEEQRSTMLLSCAGLPEASCKLGPEGWKGKVPACGMKGSWIRCSWLAIVCLQSSSSKTQSCR